VDLKTLLVILTVLLFIIWWELSRINSRLKDRFATEREEDYKWSQADPMGHWEAHKNNKSSKEKG
jgi:hypothetical protein